MWTFTIDPTLFATPEEAFYYVRDKRCIAETIRQLHRWGHLHTAKFFAVIEWQDKTQMPHWHVLLDATFVPFEAACASWNRFRPRAAGKIVGRRPGFGSVRFTASTTGSGAKRLVGNAHAANYACAYLIKPPRHGYPAWVLNLRGKHVHRYTTSRGFWDRSGQAAEDETDATAVAENLFAEGQPDGQEEHGEAGDSQEAEEKSSIAERVGRCGRTSVVLQVAFEIDRDTGEVVKRFTFYCHLPMPLERVAGRLGRSVEAGGVWLEPHEIPGILEDPDP